ncbi:choline O-acetyltransferase [Thrips palmi]|uniref:Choline O-acetyltransferase n=1 Tax=Thrips palmi TaxID=161013 RepID=A0A6P8YXE9_THRPL|nr:choline O-acetyltransferase [Thrips palmi]
MKQFYRLMTTVRNPGNPKDQQVTTDIASDYIVVARHGQFYVVQVRGDGGGPPVSEDSLTGRLASILAEPVPASSAAPIGLLTTLRRDKWAEARQHLREDPVNRTSLDAIEGSLFILCLDSPITTAFNSSRALPARGHAVEGRDETNMAHQMLHGGGSKANSGNRWFDKTIQLVISSDGVCGLCYEHSAAEGMAVIQLMEKMLSEATNPAVAAVTEAPRSPPAVVANPPPRLLGWNVDSVTRAHLQEAAKAVDSMIDDLDFYVYRFTEYGKEFMKSCKCSPDAYIQLALQLAYIRLFGKPTATYESGSLRRFDHGRVDAIRGASCEAWQWAAAMLQQKQQAASPIAVPPLDTTSGGDEKKVTFVLYDDNQKRELFRAAIKKQTDVMVQNILGHGIDNHLLGLREVAKELGEPVPELFTDESYRVANHFALSTSQVPTTTDSFMGYGPVVPDGYGASYNPKADSIVFCLSSFHSAETTSTAAFARALERSLQDMRTLLQEAPPPPTPSPTPSHGDALDLK